MNDLQIFENSEFGKIRTITKDNEPMFCLADVCKALELTNSRSVADRLEDDERCKLDLPRQGETWFVTESGLYAVILRSDKPNAKKFRKCVPAGETQTVASICQIHRERKRLVCLKGQAQRAERLGRTADVCHSKGKRNIPSAFGRKGVSLLFRR